jgi:hypothetical protein
MSHQSVSGAVRLVALVIVAAIGLSIAVPAGSQPVRPPRPATSPSSLSDGTVVLHFIAESGEQKLLDVVLRCARPDFSVMASSERNEGPHCSWRLQGRLELVAAAETKIRVDVQQAHIAFQMKGFSLDLNTRAGAVLTSGEEKILLKTDDVTLRVQVDFEPLE